MGREDKDLSNDEYACTQDREGGLFRYILMFLYVDTTLLAFSKSVASIPEQRRARIIKEGGRRERESGSLTKDERKEDRREVNNARNSLRPRAHKHEVTAVAVVFVAREGGRRGREAASESSQVGRRKKGHSLPPSSQKRG